MCDKCVDYSERHVSIYGDCVDDLSVLRFDVLTRDNKLLSSVDLPLEDSAALSRVLGLAASYKWPD